jgi:nucleotide-binding universal stress UspA family protein
MKIILATDGTEYAEAAVKMAGKLGLGDGDEILVVSVVDMAMPLGIDMYGGYLPDTSALENAARESSAKVVNDAAEELREIFAGKNVAISSDVLFGSPDSRIVETAEEKHADLIIIGSHGYKSWERLLLGSVSNSVVHHAPCSVMVVRKGAE